MTTESVERRVLGAVRFVDAVTRQRVDSSLRVRADNAAFIRNRPGDYVITSATGLEEHDSFERPGAIPALGTVPIKLTVQDPEHRYLARQCTVKLPLDTDPAHADDDASIFAPAEVSLYPTAGGPTWPGWAIIRASVGRAGPVPGAAITDPLPDALLRVVRVSDTAVLGRGMTDARGEALVGVAGIPVTTFSSEAGPVLATSVAVVIQVIADPNATGAPDPDDLEERRAALLVRTSAQLVLASGKALKAAV